MSERIDDMRIRSIIVAAIGPHSCIHEAREKGLYVVHARARAIELALPLGTRLAQIRFKAIPRGSRVEFRDLEQAAALGVIDGVDRFKPAMGVLVSSLITTWVSKHLGDEVDRTHWATVKPSKADRRKYFGRDGMTDDERRAYEKQFMSGAQADFDGDWNGVERTGAQL